MSTTEPSQDQDGGLYDWEEDDGALSIFDLNDHYGQFAGATSPAELAQHLADWDTIEKPFMSEASYATVTSIDTALMQAYEAGALEPSQWSAFFRWLWTGQGIATVTGAMATGGVLLGLVDSWATAQGNDIPALEAALNPYQFTAPTFVAPPPDIVTPPPTLSDNQGNTNIFPGPAPVQFPSPPAAPSPTTPGGHIVKTAVQTTTPVAITQEGLTPAEAAAIGAAIQAETSKLTGIIASTVDEALGGLQPGQAKGQIASNARNISALRRAVANLQVSVAADNTVDIKADVATLTTEVDKLISQLDLTEPSALDTHVNTVADTLGTQINGIGTHVTQLVGQMDLTIPSALDTRVNGIGDQVTRLVGQLDLTIPSALDTHLNAVDATAADALRIAEDDALCCDANSAVTKPITEGGATPSLLKQLGGLLLGASVLTAIVSTLGVVAAMFDGKLELAAIVSDTETVTGWVVDAIDGAPDSSTWLATMVPVGS